MVGRATHTQHNAMVAISGGEHGVRVEGEMRAAGATAGRGLARNVGTRKGKSCCLCPCAMCAACVGV